jgi:hypothetical protein
MIVIVKKAGQLMLEHIVDGTLIHWRRLPIANHDPNSRTGYIIHDDEDPSWTGRIDVLVRGCDDAEGLGIIREF